jgi:hypothetical protein
MNTLVKISALAILTIFAVPRTNAQVQNPLKKFYTIYNYENELLDSNYKKTIINGTVRYTQGFGCVLKKGERLFFQIESRYDLYVYIKDSKGMLDSVYHDRGELYGVSGMHSFIAPFADTFNLSVVGGKVLEEARYSLSFLKDHLQENVIPSNTSFEDRLETLLDLRYFNFAPIVDSMISEKEDMFEPYRIYSTRFELVKGKKLKYISRSGNDFAQAYIEVAPTIEKGMAQLGLLKKRLDAYFKINRKKTSAAFVRLSGKSLTEYQYKRQNTQEPGLIIKVLKEDNGYNIILQCLAGNF